MTWDPLGSATVPLQAGSNLIDVGASAHGAAPAWNALRITREVLVTLPDLIGAIRADAIDQLDALGLRAKVEEDGDLLDELLGGDWIVCASDPPAGSNVRRGSSVHLAVSRSC